MEIRRRVDAEGAADGDVRDMTAMWIMGFDDPDGFYVEVIWHKPDVQDSKTLPRVSWTSVELSQSRPRSPTAEPVRSLLALPLSAEAVA